MLAMASKKKVQYVKTMVDSLHSMIAAHQDNFIESVDFRVLGPPSASYIVERRSTRMPSPAPVYGPNSVSTMRCVLADAGWVDPKSIHLVATVVNIGADPSNPW